MSYQPRSIVVTLTISVVIYTVFLTAYKVVYSFFEDGIVNNANVQLEEHPTTRIDKQRRI